MDIPLDSIICHDIVKPFPLPDECIDVVITSPPYWGLRDYGVKSIFDGSPTCNHKWKDSAYIRNNDKTAGKKQKTNKGSIDRDTPVDNSFCMICNAWQGQLGLEPHPQMFIDHLVMICREIKRVLKKSGSFYLNLGDTYFGKPKSSYEKSGLQIKNYGDRYSKQGYENRGDTYNKICNSSNWLQPKQLMLMPVRIAIALQDDGWILRNDIIWYKPNPMPSSVKDRLNNTFEHVFHFVKSKKYYYDLDTIREPHKIESLERAEYGFNVIPRAWEQEVIPVSGGKDVNIDCHPLGRNPGDVIRDSIHHGSSLSNKPTYYDQQIFPMCDPKGKNPGDVITYDSKYKESEYGQTPQGFTRVQSIAKERVQSRIDAKKLFPDNPKKQQEYINYIHDHGACPLGSNPGDIIATRDVKDKSYKTRDPGRHINPKGSNPSDVVKHDIAVGRIGDFSYNDPLHTKGYHPKGKNPGDVIQFNEEYWWNFILGRAHPNKFYKKAYELMREWMVKNNCFDYNIFYEWYKKEFEGKWESGDLEKGKANYLSDEKRLPFPKPETRFLGDKPGDFWKQTPEYIIGSLAEKIRDFEDAHPDADLGWLDEIIRDIVLAKPNDFIYPNDFWSITTQPFTGFNPDLEHFAVFPEELVLKPLKASCPQLVCKKCGKPKKKVIKSGGYEEAFNIRVRDVKEGRIKHTDRIASKKEIKNYDEDSYVSKVKKHIVASGCNCNAGFDAGIVLDPFAGRGTVGKVAKQLGLHYILFDIKHEYCELARLYIAGQKYKLHKDQTKLK